MSKYKNKLPAVSGVLFLLSAVISVGYAWITGVHRFDMSLSFSLYVGLFYWTSTLHFALTAVIVALMSVYVAGTKMPAVKKAVYAAVLLCIFGTAFFPCNAFSDHGSPITTTAHNIFAISLMLVTTVSFIITVITSKDKIQRFAAALSILYGAVFITLYFMRFAPLFATFFIWENLFIVLLLIGMSLESRGENAK